MQSKIDLAIAAIREHRQFSPEFGIILGSGLGPLADSILHPTDLNYGDIPGFPTSSAAGHAGSLRFGFLGGVPVVVMRGRAHLYEGHSVQTATFPVRVMKRLGCHSIIVSNASGGLNPRLKSGQLVLIDQHINLMFQTATLRPLNRDNNRTTDTAGFESAGRHVPFYDPSYIAQCESIAIRSGFSLDRATYLATLGPTYETRAEYRFFRNIGADLAGMSTVPEVELARSLGMRVLAFSVVTNVANPDNLEKTDHSDVLDWAQAAQTRLVPLVTNFLDETSGPPD